MSTSVGPLGGFFLTQTQVQLPGLELLYHNWHHKQDILENTPVELTESSNMHGGEATGGCVCVWWGRGGGNPRNITVRNLRKVAKGNPNVVHWLSVV